MTNGNNKICIHTTHMQTKLFDMIRGNLKSPNTNKWNNIEDNKSFTSIYSYFLLLLFFFLSTDDCDKDGTSCTSGACLDSLCHCNDGFGGCNCQVPGKHFFQSIASMLSSCAPNRFEYVLVFVPFLPATIKTIKQKRGRNIVGYRGKANKQYKKRTQNKKELCSFN
jgi:hypothetical protein